MTSLRCFSLVLLITILFHLCHCVEYNHTIYIDPENGHDNSSCINSNSPSVLCRSLDFALRHRANSTQYVLLEGTHILNHVAEPFEGLDTLAFTGTNMDTTIIECANIFIGFAFVDMHTLHFSNLTFNGCSALRNSTTRNFYKTEFALYKILVGLYFYHCHNVEMSHVTVSNSPIATGVVMYDTDGIVTIADSVFTNNTVPPKDEYRPFPGGGGFYVEFSYCVPGDDTCTDERISYESRNRGAQYLFSRSTFSHNRANNSDNVSVSTFIIPHRSNHESFGRGGGLSILINGNASDNIISVSECFFDSNEAVWGGGLFVEYHDNTANNTINVLNSNFTNNKCYFTTHSGTGSGGMRIGYFVYDNVNGTKGNTITVDGCTFRNNSALNGGGLSIIPVSQSTSQDLITKISIINSVFVNNVARLGSAITVDRFSLIQGGSLPNISVENCTFTSNIVEYVKNISGYESRNVPYQVGKGAVFIHQISVSFRGEIHFSGNIGTALAVVTAIINFTECNATFNSNTGNNGGAIALLGAAHILINDDTNMTFFNNKATSEGGAIYNKYIEDENLQSYTIYTNCFIRHVNPYLAPENWMSYFEFYNNFDHCGNRKSSIHSTSILPCSWAGGSGVSSNKSSIFCWNRWIYWEQPFTLQGSCKGEVNSDVGNITFIDTYRNDNSIEAFPGQPFQLPINVRDDLHTDVSAHTVFLGSTDSNGSAVGDLNQYGDSAYIWGESISVRGAENDSITVLLDSLGDRVWHVEVVVNLLTCPPGFKSSDKTGNNTITTTCVCAGTYQQAVTCDQNSLKAYLKNDNWMGPPSEQDDSNYVVVICPPGYCYTNIYSGSLLLPNNTDELDRLVCGTQNRTGIVCGECIEGFGPAINSLTYECVNCSDHNVVRGNIVKYVFSVYVPLAILFTILILLDIRLTTGPANAFILYCQVVASTFDLNADGQVPLNLVTNSSDKLLDAVRIPYAIFNLEFIENFLPPLCLGTHLNTLSLLLMKYVVALAPVLMILFVILCVKLTSFITNRCCRGESMFHRMYVGTRNRDENGQRHEITEAILPAFATFLLLSYNKFSTISTFLVDSQPLLREDGSAIHPPRVYYDGQYSTHDPEYCLHYLLPAVIIFSTFVIIPPLLLLDYPLRVFEWCLSKVNCLWKYYRVDKVHVFLDTFQGCYKNKMRFFAGLYFLFRLVVNIAYILANTWLAQFAVQQVACVIMIMLLALCQPYKKKWLNYVDILIFTNLAVLNSLSFYLYSFSQINPQTRLPPSAFAVQYSLVFLPLFYMISYIVWNLTQPCHRYVKHRMRSCFRILAENAKIGNFRPLEDVAMNIGVATPILSSSVSEEENDTEALFARAEFDNTFRPNYAVQLDRNPDDVIVRSSENSYLHPNPRRGYGSVDANNQREAQVRPQTN